MLADGPVPPSLVRGAVRRLVFFAQPFIAALPSPESRRHAHTDLAGLLSNVERN
ncbi:hypothetical protein [Tautonia sociabilis]|uniref:hypothetical protein n=1 Tax=Tautonia sociabilis TaxID=2080755 RepID=UPI001315080A|nr:hypothetical protein [Tautonia sociabilis]